MRKMAWLAWLCVAVVSETAFGQQFDEPVIAIRDTEMTVGEMKVRNVACGQVLEVREIKGEWLLVSDQLFNRRTWREEDEPGWIDKEHVSTPGKALRLFTEQIAQSPLEPKAYLARGLALRCLFVKDSIEDFDEAIRLDPTLAEAFCRRGVAWQEQGKDDKALADFDEAIRLDPKAAEAYYNRAQIWRHEGQFDKAIAEYASLVRLNPKDATALFNRAFFGHDSEKAIADYDEAIRLNPKLRRAHLFRGQLLRDKGRYDKAIADFDEAIRLDPNDAVPLKERAWLQATCSDDRFRDGRTAVEQATKACELNKWKNGDFIETLAAAHAEVGNFAMAVKWQTQACDMVKDFRKSASRSKLELYRSGKPFRDEPRK